MKRPSGKHEPVLDPAIDEALLEAQAPVLPPPDRALALRNRVLGRARQEASHRHPLDHLTVRGADGIWVRVMPGVKMKMLREDEQTRSYLMKLSPGARLPAHGHAMDEECMVLEGDVWLGDVHAHAGDYHLARSGIPHGEVRTEGGCLLFLRGQKHYADMRAG